MWHPTVGLRCRNPPRYLSQFHGRASINIPCKIPDGKVLPHLGFKSKVLRSSCSVSGGFWRWWRCLPSSSHKCPIAIGDRFNDNAGQGRTRMWFCMVQKVLTNTSHVTSCIVMLTDVIKASLLQKGKNDGIKNIVSVFYDIQYSLNNFELSATIVKNSSPDHYTSASKTVGLVHTLVRKKFPTPAVNTITSIGKTKWKSGFITKKDVLPGVKPPTMACTSPG